jgi:hypothetical protein
LLFVLLSKMYGGATFDLDRKVHMAHIAIILSENNLSDIIIEEIVCRNTCFVCNYNIWITFYIFLWNYESIKVGVQLVFNTIWEWHRFTAVIWENDTKSFIFPKLKMISAQNFEGNTTVLCTFCWTWCFFCRRKKWQPFCSKWPPFFHKIHQTGNLFQDNLIIFFINIINITEKMDMEICTNDLLFVLAFY